MIQNPPRYKLLDITACKEHISGFFNGTPGDVAAIDGTGTTAQGFHIVSAEWYDWRRFILHPCDPSIESQPELVATDGTPIRVLGYIYGSWTDDKLRRQWKGLQVWVVQASFFPDASQDGQSCHFILNPKDLCKSREHECRFEQTCPEILPFLFHLF